MGSLKQIKNDISYVLWVMGITGWVEKFAKLFGYERHMGEREDCARCAAQDEQPDAYPESAG